MRLFLFDLDNTLYPRSRGVVPRIDRRINEYMATRLGIVASEVDEMRKRFWEECGTTLRGLMARFDVDADEFLAYVHDVELSDVLEPDAELRRVLENVPGRRAVLSNASRSHAAHVLRLLGVEQCFDAVLALEDLQYVPKPLPEAYRIALAELDAHGPECWLVEDTLKNLSPAKDLGMRTVWVSEEPAADAAADYVIRSVHHFEGLLSDIP